ncbi:MAG: S8 family serine peptidase, partial [Flavobacteriaceae bacterium]
MIKIKLNLPAILLCSGLVLLSCSTNELESETQELNTLEDIESITMDDAKVIPGQYIILFNDESLASRAKSAVDYASSKRQVHDFARQLFTEKNLNEVEFVHTYSKSVMGATIKLSDNQVEALRQDKRVSLIEQDRIYMFAPPCGTPKGGPCDPDDGDPGDGGGDGGDSTQETPWGIARVNGAQNYTGTNVAYILDSGIDLTHEDLNVNASLGFNAFTSGQDGNSLNDLNGHGTHVAGTVAAKNNNVGVIGVAPGATVVPVKVLDRRGSGSYSGVIAGVDFIAANGSNGDVANMSLGGPISVALDNAIINAAQNGVKFTLAAGNESQNANN